MSGTRVSLTSEAGDYNAAYQGTDGHLWVVLPSGRAADTGARDGGGDQPPSIAATDTSNFTVAFQANTTGLCCSPGRTDVDSRYRLTGGATRPSHGLWLRRPRVAASVRSRTVGGR
jgi:hypothetical protein